MKEMTEYGPRRKMVDVLAAQAHRTFTMEADWYLESGFVSQDERIAISNAVGRALDAFNQALPEEVANRYLDPPYVEVPGATADPLYMRFFKAVAGVFKEKKTDPSVVVFKDEATGQWWMLGVYSNRFEDREKDILSEESHLEYAKWFQDSGIEPVVTLLHYPRMPKGFWEKVWQDHNEDIPTLNKIIEAVYQDFAVAKAVRVTPLNGFTLVASKVIPGKEQIAQNLAAMSKDLGMSHGFIVLEKAAKVIGKYRTFEFTNLPKERAANVFTQPFFTEVKDMAFPPEDREFLLAGGIPSDVLDSLDKSTANAFERLAPITKYKEFALEGESPMSNEEVKTPVTTPQEEVIPTPTGTPEGAVETAASYETIRDQLIKDFNISGLNGMLAEMQKKIGDQATLIESLQKQLGEASQEIKSVKMDEDSKIAAQFSPINWGNTGFSATKDDANVIPNAQELKKQAPGAGVPSGNPLQDMLWGPVLATPTPNSK